MDNLFKKGGIINMVRFNKNYYLVAAIFFVAFIVKGFYKSELKIGWLNSITVLNQYNESIKVQKKIDQERQRIQNEIKDMQDEFNRKSKELENQALLLSDERKTEMQKELQALSVKIQQTYMEKLGPEGELAKRQDQLMQPIIEKTQQVINKIAKDENYDWVFDSANGAILFVKDKDKYDLTKKVIDELNKGTKK